MIDSLKDVSMNSALQSAIQDGKRQAGFYALVGLVALCYAALRFTYNPPFDATFLQKIFDFTAPTPFGRRVLPALLAHPLVAGGLSLMQAYLVLEVAATGLLLLGLCRTFALHAEPAQARVMGIGFAFVLPLVFLLRNPFPYYFPWDTPAMAFLAWAVYFLLRGWWVRSLVLMVFAALNRESAVLVPLLFGALYADRLPLGKLFGLGLAFLVLYFAVAALVGATCADNFSYYGSGTLASLHKYGIWRYLYNANWLRARPLNVFVLLSTLGGLPVAFLVFYRHVPPYLRRFAPVALLYFVLVAIVGNVYESRTLGEIVVILYLPVAVGCRRLLAGADETDRAFALPGADNVLRPYMARLEAAVLAAILAAAVAVYFVLKAHPPPP